MRDKTPATSSHQSRCAVAVFFVGTFVLTSLFWGGAALGGQEWTRFPTIALYVLGGMAPSVVAILLVYRWRTSISPRDFWRRTFDPRTIRWRWYLIIIVVAFAPAIIARVSVSGGESEADGDAAFFIVAMILVAILAGFAEELGWRGYALDRLLTFSPALVASLVVGLVWTLWHLPLYFIDGTIQSESGLWSSDFWFDMTARIPLAVLFAWIYVNTARSILSAVLFHGLENLASVLVSPEGTQLVVRLAIFIALAIAVTAWYGPRTLARREATIAPRPL